MIELRSKIEVAREKFFARHNWQLKQCPICHTNYYTKRDLPHCGSYQCSGNCYAFTKIPAPKSYLEFEDYVARFRIFFRERNYNIHPPISILRNNERTLFASTAGQVYDSLIYGTNEIDKPCQCAILQPVIRLQGINLVSSMEGISTSFLHTATESWNSNIDEHFNAFDQWLDYFSSLGLHVGGLCLKTKQAANDWSDRTITSEMIKINYDGLEIGVANFFLDIRQTSNTISTLSDIGVGAERLVWAINKSPSYFDGIGPVSCVILIERDIIDCIRTATLMAASGVIPDHKNQGSKLRAIIGHVANHLHCLNFYELIRYYYKQWSLLINLPISRDRTYSVIWNEINRTLNLQANRLFKIDEPDNKNHEEFLRQAIQKKSINISHLWEIKRGSP